MKCFYINLDDATVRRQSIERSFAQFNSHNWILERFPAFNIDYVRQHAIPGRIRDVEKACFLSHRTILERCIGLNQHLTILEDDAMFCDKTIGTLETLLKVDDASFVWDLLFTDVGIVEVGAMANLVKLKMTLTKRQQGQALDLRSLPFVGSTAYVVNKNSIEKLASLVADNRLDLPYDLFLRKLIYERKLNAFVTFPFLTSISVDAGDSTVQPSEYARTDLIWNLFRRMIWIGGDGFDPSQALSLIGAPLSERSKAYGMLWASMVDASFLPK